MKLNTLLLSSAAVLVAGPAFAADLPSKKAAPAAAVTACKVGDTTGFTLPGTETCLKINGRVTYDVKLNNKAKSSDGKSDYTLTPGFRVGFDALSNTEIGVVRTFVRIHGGSALSTGKAYLQFAGFTAGVKDSLTDIYGTTANNPTLAGSGSQGIDYKLSAGGFSLALGVEDAQNNNTKKPAGTAPTDPNAANANPATDVAGDRPDLAAQLSGSAGPATIKVAAVSHQSVDGSDNNKSYDGYAIKGSVAVALGQFNLIGFGGTAKGASKFIGGTTNITDYDGGNAAESTGFGGEINATFGKLLVAVEAANYEHELTGLPTEKVTEFDVYASYTVAKGLTIQPEYTNYNRSGAGSDEDTVMLRIQRDF